MQEIVTRKQYAEHRGVHPNTVTNWIKKGMIDDALFQGQFKIPRINKHRADAIMDSEKSHGVRGPDKNPRKPGSGGHGKNQGRPKLGRKKKGSIMIRLPLDMVSEFEKLAEQHGVTRGTIIRKAIETAMNS